MLEHQQNFISNYCQLSQTKLLVIQNSGIHWTLTIQFRLLTSVSCALHMCDSSDSNLQVPQHKMPPNVTMLGTVTPTPVDVNLNPDDES
jgi:hypothetical protein